jgi:hypothetical protein
LATRERERNAARPDRISQDAQQLIDQLNTAKTTAELWRIGRADDFQAAVNVLSESDRTAVREHFLATDTLVKGKITAEDVAAKWDDAKQQHVGGTALRVTSWDFPPPSPRYPDSRFCVLKGVREDTGEKFEMVSGAKRVTRFFENLDPTKDAPQRIMLIEETPDEMAQRQAKPGTSAMWLVRRLNPNPSARKTGNTTPF